MRANFPIDIVHKSSGVKNVKFQKIVQDRTDRMAMTTTERKKKSTVLGIPKKAVFTMLQRIASVGNDGRITVSLRSKWANGIGKGS